MDRDNKGKFTDGNKGGGRKPLPDDVKAARALSYAEMCRTVIEVRSTEISELEKMSDEDKGKLTLGKRAIMTAYAKLDYRGIKDYEDRLWGKAKESIDLNPEGNGLKIEIDWG